MRQVSTEDRLREASRHLSNNETEAAQAILNGLSIPSSLVGRASYISLHKQLGTTFTDIETALEADLILSPRDASTAFDRAQAFVLLDHPDRLDAAQHAFTLNPSGEGPILLLLKVQLETKDIKAAFATVEEAATHHPSPGGLLLACAKIFAQAGYKDHATRLLDMARPLQGDKMAEFNFVAAGINGTQPESASQAEMAETIFDKFAKDYDKVLTDIGYKVPELITEMLAATSLKKNKRLQVLDAGCGTGLCAKLLRPYAKGLHGADISAAMLEKAKKKRVYNNLTRADLNQPATIPLGPFDLVVAADVLIYFGDLSAVIMALSQRLSPAGWLLLTVEDGGELPASGFDLGTSGRFKHSQTHIEAALAAAGMGRPKQLHHRVLRHEFGTAINGLAVAAQKPMLAL